MQFLEKELCHCVEMIWTTLFGFHLSRKADAPLPGTDHFRCATRIQGHWNGWLVITLTPALSQKASHVFFGPAEADDLQENIEETLKEIANQVGGNLKHLLPQPSSLDIPVMSFNAGDLDFHGAQVRTRLIFDCDGDPVEFQILEMASAPSH